MHHATPLLPTNRSQSGYEFGVVGSDIVACLVAVSKVPTTILYGLPSFRLEKLNLKSNRIATLDFSPLLLARASRPPFAALCELDLSTNEIKDWHCFDSLLAFQALQILSISENPATKNYPKRISPFAALLLQFNQRQIEFIDFHPNTSFPLTLKPKSSVNMSDIRKVTDEILRSPERLNECDIQRLLEATNDSTRTYLPSSLNTEEKTPTLTDSTMDPPEQTLLSQHSTFLTNVNIVGPEESETFVGNNEPDIAFFLPRTLLASVRKLHQIVNSPSYYWRIIDKSFAQDTFSTMKMRDHPIKKFQRQERRSNLNQHHSHLPPLTASIHGIPILEKMMLKVDERLQIVESNLSLLSPGNTHGHLDKLVSARFLHAHVPDPEKRLLKVAQEYGQLHSLLLSIDQNAK